MFIFMTYYYGVLLKKKLRYTLWQKDMMSV